MKDRAPAGGEFWWTRASHRRWDEGTEHDLSLTPSTTPPPLFRPPGTTSVLASKTTPFLRKLPVIVLPSKEVYTSLVSASQSHLHAGSSYELCLTARTSIHLPTPKSPWGLNRGGGVVEGVSERSCSCWRRILVDESQSSSLR